jgi:nucleoid DNA-binding protein
LEHCRGHAVPRFSPFFRREGSSIVTKKEIVKTISEEIGLTQLKTKEIVQKTFDAIVETLVEDGRIELRNFGVFEVKKRAARKARNPRTGDRVDVPEKYVVTFKPGKEMEERVRLLEEQDRAARLARERAEAEAQQREAARAAGSSSSDGGSRSQSAATSGSVGGSARVASASLHDAPTAAPPLSTNGSADSIGSASLAASSGESRAAENDDSAENNLRQPAL